MTLRIHDWKDWQTYRSDRGQPPWLKIHRQLLRSGKWLSLTDAERGQLVSMWILAADNNGELPDDASLIQKMAYLDNPPDIERFINLKLVDGLASKRRQVGVKLTPCLRQSDAPEADTEAEAETEEEKRQKQRKKREDLARPSDVQTVIAYMTEQNIADPNGNAEKWWAHYESKGWLIGKTTMRNWKAAVRTWNLPKIQRKAHQHHQAHQSDVAVTCPKCTQRHCRPESSYPFTCTCGEYLVLSDTEESNKAAEAARKWTDP